MVAASKRRKGARQPSTRFSALLALTGLVFACGAAVESPAIEVATGLFPAGWSLHESVRAVEAAGGMVTSGHPLASQVGSDVLARGGNAIDAAVAVGFALAVVLPEAGNIGGGGFLVYRDGEGGVHALDYREKAPGNGHHDMYLDDEGNVTEASRVGHLAAGVPGSVAGMAAMHEKFGSLPWESLVAPAVDLAVGHVIDEVRAANLSGGRHLLARFETSAQQFLIDGESPSAGQRWSQPELADTLRRIAKGGASEFYEGETADLLVAEMERGGGLITIEDLAAYRAVWRDPVRVAYRDHVVWSMPPSSSGGVAMAMIFNILEGFDVLPAFGSPDLVHLEAEAMRWAFIDRNQYLGDPDFVDMPLERLLSKGYAAELRGRVDPGSATPTPTFQIAPEGTSTTHYSVVGRDGRAASITTTINSFYGNGVTVAGAGFLLNNEMDDFAAKPGVPNQFGLVQGEANAVAPHKRMLSSMSPAVVEDAAGELRMVVGTPGGSTIITSVFQVISNVLDHGMSLPEAVAAPRVHHQALPDVVFFEPGGLTQDAQDRLGEMGYVLRERQRTSGDIQAIMRTESGWLGVPDPRRGGAAVGPD
ncbi:MAG: gamma-glutamyltransferase [Acidobacteriota bacterium]|nr:gamma-glutamyltransferase [Acidobacteriota bacterium]